MADVDHLYGLPLEEFTPARDAAAKEIRKGGDRETAAIVAKLPKPTPAAWTANQVAREQPELIEAMLAAGEELREAQEAAVQGGGGRGLRDATLAERRAVEEVMAAATSYKPAGKPLSRAMADRLRTTLHAAAGDEAIRDALADGRLVDEAQAGGAWPFALEPTPREERPAKKRAAKKAAAKTGATKAKRGAKDDAADEAAAAAERERAEAEAKAAAERAAAETAGARRSSRSCGRRVRRCACASGSSPGPRRTWRTPRTSSAGRRRRSSRRRRPRRTPRPRSRRRTASATRRGRRSTRPATPSPASKSDSTRQASANSFTPGGNNLAFAPR